MRSTHFHFQTAVSHILAIITTTITPISSAPTNPTPHLLPPLKSLNHTAPLPQFKVDVWPTLPWWTKLRNSNLDPPAYLDVFSISTHSASLQEAYILQERVLLPLALQIHQGAGPANVSERITVGGMGAEFVPGEGRKPSREVVATAVVALAAAEGNFGARGVRGAVRVGEVRVGALRAWVGGGGWV